MGLFQTQPTAGLPDANSDEFGGHCGRLLSSAAERIIKGWMRGLLFWLGALAIVAGFTLLELQADLAFPGFAHKLVLAAILLIEFGAIWFWSQIIRR